LKGHWFGGLWRKFSRDWALRWDFGDLGAVLLIIGFLLTGILSKLNEAGWAIVTIIVLCCLLAGLHRHLGPLQTASETDPRTQLIGPQFAQALTAFREAASRQN
jgi:hypothetical protein